MLLTYVAETAVKAGMTTAPRKPYPSNTSNEEWALAAPYLTLMREDAGQPEHSMRELPNGLRYVVRTGIPWRAMPHDLRAVLPMAGEREPEPRTAVPAQPCGFAWTAARSAARPKAGPGPAATGPSASGAPRSTSPWRRNRRSAPTLWGNCWCHMSPRPTLRTATPLSGLPRKSRRPQARASRWPT